MDPILLETFQKLTEAFNAMNARLDQMQSHIDVIAEALDGHLEAPVVTRDQLEEVRLDVHQMKRFFST